MKWCIPAFFAVFSLPYIAFGQDTIYKKDDVRIIAKVINVDNSTVTYKRYDNLDGPDYVILKKTIRYIAFSNGTEDNMTSRRHQGNAPHYGDVPRSTPSSFRKNILSIIPVAYTAEVFEGSINDPGVGISYERILDEDGHFGLCIPLIISFVQNKDFTGEFFTSTAYLYNGSPLNVNGNYYSYFLMPELKCYPAGKSNSVRYSLGGPFFAQFGKIPAAVYNNYVTGNGSSFLTSTDKTYSMFGFAISNAVNITIARSVFLELDANLMVPFSDNRRPNVDGSGQSYAPIVQYAIKFGYKF